MKFQIHVQIIAFSIVFVLLGTQNTTAQSSEQADSAPAATSETNSKEKSPLSIYITTDAAYYTKSKYRVSDKASHFAPVTGAYNGIECATTLFADYTINTQLGKNWLLKDANVLLQGAVELTPISVRPQISIGFQPLPFLVLKGGSSVGLGWNCAGFEGLCKLNEVSFGKPEYKGLSTFRHPFYSLWGEALLMFDTGAVIKGDWSHIVMLASYKTLYSGIAGIERHTPYEWQATKNKAQGLQYEAKGIIAYQMPLMLYRAGFMYKAEGHFDGSDYGEFDKLYNGDFATISLSPLLQFKFSEKNELYCLIDFSSRRSFETKHKDEEEEFYLKSTGREWYFKRLALSWTHYF